MYSLHQARGDRTHPRFVGKRSCLSRGPWQQSDSQSRSVNNMVGIKYGVLCTQLSARQRQVQSESNSVFGGWMSRHLHLGTYYHVPSLGLSLPNLDPCPSLFFPQPTTRPPCAWQQMFEELQIPAAPPPTLSPPPSSTSKRYSYTHAHAHTQHTNIHITNVLRPSRSPSLIGAILPICLTKIEVRLPLVVIVVSSCHLSPSAAGFFHVFFSPPAPFVRPSIRARLLPDSLHT